MNVLITGATGFIGQQVVHSLSSSNANLFLVTRDSNTLLKDTFKNIKGIFISKDIFLENQSWWINVTKNIDIIIHLAWYVEPGKYLQSEKNLECLKGTITLAQAAAKNSVKRFVGIGTCFEYDLSEENLTIQTPLLPTTPYAAAKASVYSNLSQWLPIKNVQFCWCRLFYLYGENEDRRRLVPYLRTKLEKGEIAELTSGHQIRDFLDVKDAGRMIADTALSDIQGAVNVCSEIAITVRQLAENIADEYNRRDLLKFGARPDNIFDPKRVVGVRY